MNDITALIAAIAEQPEEDTPRLVAADWYDENGEPGRAGFIRAQVALARETISARAMETVARVIAHRAKNKPINFPVGRVPALMVEQHLALVRFGRDWRFVKCRHCNGRGKVRKTARDGYKDFNCSECREGDAGGLVHYRGHYRGDVPETHQDGEYYSEKGTGDSFRPYRGTFRRGFLESVGVEMEEVVAGKDQVTDFIVRMVKAFPTVQRLLVTNAVPLVHHGRLRTVYAWAGGVFGSTTMYHIPEPVWSFIDWNNAYYSDHSHGYKGWASAAEANTALAEGVVRCVKWGIRPTSPVLPTSRA